MRPGGKGDAPRCIALLSFTERGARLAEYLADELGGVAFCTKRLENFSLPAWTGEMFRRCDALIFVGAAGIAVRAAAPYLKNKASDPAVVAVDECGRYAVPLVSGHLGGANDLAREIAALCGAEAVITTATDRGGIFAVDEWARWQDFTVMDPRGIKRVSARILAGETLEISSAWPVAGEPPEGVRLTDGPRWDVRVDIRSAGDTAALQLVPSIAVLGVGCRRGTERKTLERVFTAFCEKTKLFPEAVCMAATIDLKAEEPGLLDFCREHSWPLKTCSPERLRQTEGTFTASEFVRRTTGVDNVCERAAVLASGGALYAGKYADEGVTMALAVMDCRPDWRWKYE